MPRDYMNKGTYPKRHIGLFFFYFFVSLTLLMPQYTSADETRYGYCGGNRWCSQRICTSDADCGSGCSCIFPEQKTNISQTINCDLCDVQYDSCLIKCKKLQGHEAIKSCIDNLCLRELRECRATHCK